MSIRPIDFHAMVPKVQKMSAENQMTHNKNTIDHQHLVQQDKKNIEHESNRINKFEQKDQAYVKENKEQKKDRKHKKKNETRSDKQSEQEVEADKEQKNNGCNSKIGANLDIKV